MSKPTAPEERAKRIALGARVKQLREQCGLSQDDLAEMAGIGRPGRRSGPTIGAWEREGGATLDTVLKVVEAFAARLGRRRADLLAYIAWG